MTRTQLTYLYSFANLPYSEDAENLAELKKILLLELKASNNTFINVSGKKWTKNEVLSFFDVDIDQSFDYEQFVQDYPWIKDLEAVSNIQYNSDLLRVDFSDKRFSQFAQTEGIAIENNFLTVLKRRLRNQEDHLVVAMLLYKKCFLAVFQHRMEQESRSILTYRFNEIIALGEAKKKRELRKKAIFFKSQGFFSLMKEVANEDTKLLDLSLEAMDFILEEYEVMAVERMIANQQQLKHSVPMVIYLEELMDSIRESMKNRGETHTPSSENDFKHIFFITALVIVVFFLIYNYGSSSKKSKIDSKMIQKRQKIYEQNKIEDSILWHHTDSITKEGKRLNWHDSKTDSLILKHMDSIMSKKYKYTRK